MFYVYLLLCGDGTFYTGYAADLEERLKKHNLGIASKYTRSRRPVQLVYFEILPDRGSAMRRENAIKRMSRQQKKLLINGSGARWQCPG
ncbi:GIY-YIG nuclease family protein [Desulfallas sp. Bu1-1]|jgi:putative endonuclease|uniref:GIY-YIG nuclease family protein n=1 Tax=Desulfallas sp. Bu1-1 TaxID=2787620 RepID=UPI00189F893C|nr:GIY-YIG nuclease family protein [Desulfallas sp. Bu1-1]MBF7081770.1 GIY-YIG nuclease family protein [Desulfallas sp. Bu1-1]